MTADTTPESNSAVAQSEFIAREFETTVTDDDRARIAEAITIAVSNLREQIEDHRLEDLLRAESGTDVLTKADTAENELPESFTQRSTITVLFDALDYDDLAEEAGSYAGGISKVADYSMPFETNGESNRLLIEAEPIGKNLKSRNDGVGQVKDWLSRREFESDFGFATDGLRWIFVRYDPDTYTHNIIQEVDLASAFVAAFEATTTDGDPTEKVRTEAEEEIDRLFETFGRSNFLSIAGEVREVIKRNQQKITDEFYDDYIRYVFGIIEDEDRTARSLIGDGVVAPDEATGDDVRLFAVELMNRLLFVKFLEDRGVVRSDLLRTLRQTHDDGIPMASFYKRFLEPLFYEVFDTKPDERIEQIRERDLFVDIPYLNGGLFRPQVGDSEGFSETDFDVRDSVLKDIIDLLERYDFSADGGPTDLDPSVLGNVFEKTINYITTDRGDQNKELGAYYTPDEITRFCAERTVRPALLDRFKDVLKERGWNEVEVDRHDGLGSLVEDLPPSESLVESLLEEIDSFRALDPACGSGHFLTSVLGEIVAIRKSLHALRDSNPDDWLLRKKTVTQNIYGVDIVAPAVEIAKLRLWLSIIAEVDPEAMDEYDEDELALPNVVFNVRQGNSLIGFTELMETKGTENDDGSQQAALSSWGPDSVRAKYGSIIALVAKHKRTTDTNEAIGYLREAESLLEEYREDLDQKVIHEFYEAKIEDITLEQVRSYDPFHWVLEFAEAYADGKFDVVVGNPPWDVLTTNRENYFPRHDPAFRTRTLSEKDAKQNELLQDSDIAQGWGNYKEGMQMRADYFNSSVSYELQSPKVAGKTVANNQNDLSALFLERVFSLANEDGYVAQVLPGAIYSGSNTKDLRLHLLNETDLEAVVGFENHGIFPGIHPQYQFGVVAFENSGETDVLQGVFQQRNLSVLNEFRQRTVAIPKRVLEQYSPEARVFPHITKSEQVGFLNKVIEYTPAGFEAAETWYIDPYRELDRTKDSALFVEEKIQGDYPVYEGKNIYQYSYDSSFADLSEIALWGISSGNPEQSAKRFIQSKGVSSLKRTLYKAFGGEETSQSQKRFVNEMLEETRGETLSVDDVLADHTEYRIGIRDVTNSTNERTLIATVIPKGAVCVNTIHTIRPYRLSPTRDDLSEFPLHGAYERIFTDRELFAAVGLLNSLPFDSLMRTKVDSHIVMYKLRESQMPRLTDGDDWFHYISERAARLNCYGEAFTEMRDRLGEIEPATEEAERRQLQAEIDAAAFHAYGLDQEETEFVLDDFHQVQNPRVMTDEYFDNVLTYYEDLTERGPMP